MTTYSQGGFYIQELGCKVYSSSGFFSEYSVDKIENPIEKTYYFKTADEYFKHIIERIKDDVLKKIPDLSSVSIHIHAFDQTNIMHRLIITAANIMQDMLNIRRKISVSKLACIVITYKNVPIFISGASLKGL
jgi:hypothetical protein